MKSLIYISLTIFILAFFSGCCDDANDSVTCIPCAPTTSEQGKGCIYKACLESMYVCFDGSSEGTVATGATGASGASGTNVATVGGIQQFNTRQNNLDSLGGNAAENPCFRASDPSNAAAVKKIKEASFVSELQKQINMFAKTSSNLTGSDISNGKYSALYPFMSANGLAVDNLDTARQNCREVAGLSRDPGSDQDKYADKAGSLGTNAFDKNNSIVKGGQLSKDQIEVLKKGIESVAQESSGSDQACISVPSGKGPEASGGLDAVQAAAEMAKAAAVMGGKPVDMASKPKTSAAQEGNASAATAADRNNPKEFKPLASAGTPPGAFHGLSAPKLNGASATGANGNDKNSGGGLMGGDSRDPASVAPDGNSTRTENGESFEKVPDGNGGAGKAGGAFGSGLLSDGESGPTGPASHANFGTGVFSDQAGTSIDDYLSKVGTASLFEVISRRMDKWGQDLHSNTEQENFKKLAQ